jgi:hypothetical protein
MTTHKEQKQHRYSWHTYTWPLTRHSDYIDIPDRHIYDHSQGTETTSIFLTDIYMTTHKEQRLHRYSWQTYTWPLTRSRHNIDIPDTHIHDHWQGTETTSIFLTHIYMTTHKEQTQHRYSWHTYTWTRNMEQRQHRYSWQTYTWPLTRNRDYIDIPDRHIHEHSQGTETTSIFMTDIYMITHKEHTTSIFLTHIYMSTHKEQRQQRYSWHIYTWPITRNRDNIDILDRHIHDHSQGTETTSIFLTDMYMTTHKEQTTSIFLTHIYMTTHKEQRQHRYSWHIYTWPLTRNRDNIDIPDTHIYMTTHKEQRQHLYSWHIYTWPHNKEQRLHRYSWYKYTWPLTRNRDNTDIPDTHIYITTHRE